MGDASSLVEKLKLEIVKKVFLVLNDRICEQIKHLKEDMITFSQGASKKIKFGLFLLKIFKTFLTNHFNALSSLHSKRIYFSSLINLCSQINSIFLLERHVDVDVYFRENASSQTQFQTQFQTQAVTQMRNVNLKTFQAAKAEVYKDLSATFESIVKLLERDEIFNYLTSTQFDVDSLDENSENTLLFYCVFFNRNSTMNYIQSKNGYLI